MLIFRSMLILAGALILLIGMPFLGQAGPPAQEPFDPLDESRAEWMSSNHTHFVQTGTSLRGLTTPELIDMALINGEIDQGTANLYLAYALGDYQQLPMRYRSNAPWDGTFPLHHLHEDVQTMKVSPERAKIIQVLSGSCGGSSAAFPVLDSTNFHIEYSTIGGGLTIANYRDSLETSWATQINTFGWAAPPVFTSNPPPGNRYHVRIDTLGGGLYGYVTGSGTHAGYVGNNPNTAWDDVDASASCMVLNNDYSSFPGTAQQALDATTAHEFNHSIQYGYGALDGANAADDAVVEGGATWMEDEVFDSANDNYNYLWPNFNMCMGQYTSFPYPYWLTWRGLTERYGSGTSGGGEQVMQDFWEEMSKSTTSNLFPALNTALVNKGTTLADAYHNYAIAAKFNKSCGGGYVYPYCFEEAANYVATAGTTTVDGTIAVAGNNYSGTIADNYALNWVSLPVTGVYTVTLQNTSSGGQLRGSVVCDTGAALNINALPSTVGAGSTSSLTNFNPSGCTSIVAVVTNQSQTANNPTSCTARSYMLRTDDGGTIPATNYTYLPIIMKGPCVPSGESGNIGDSIAVSSGQTVCGRVSEGSDWDDVYKIWIAGSQQLTIVLTGDSVGAGGDADLYLYFPSATNIYSDVPADVSLNSGNNEFIQGTATSSGAGQYWYIDVYAWSGTVDYDLTATLSSPTKTETFKLIGTANPPHNRREPKRLN